MLWYVAIGSAIGGTLRFLLGAAFPVSSGGIPYATLLINVLGSFLVGAVVRYAFLAETLSPEIRALLTVGVCGGYTTFSTFSLETADLIEKGRFGLAFSYVTASVVLSLLATFAGFAVARSLGAGR